MTECFCRCGSRFSYGERALRLPWLFWWSPQGPPANLRAPSTEKDLIQHLQSSELKAQMTSSLTSDRHHAREDREIILLAARPIEVAPFFNLTKVVYLPYIKFLNSFL